MITTHPQRYFALLLMGFGLLLGLTSYASLGETGINTKLAANNTQRCAGVRCEFIGTWIYRAPTGTTGPEQGTHVVHADLNMRTLLQAAGIRLPNNQLPPRHNASLFKFEAGQGFSIPIVPTGEIIAFAARFYDSPPIVFHADGRVVAHLQGIDRCNIRANVGEGTVAEGDTPEGYEQFANEVTSQRRVACTPSRGRFTNDLADNKNIVGRWRDTWVVLTDPDRDGQYTTPTSQVTCTSVSHVLANCTSAPNFPGGKVRLELQRTVDDFNWENGFVYNRDTDTWNAGDVPDVARTHWGRSWDLTSPFPGTMKTAAYVYFVPVTQCSDKVDNDGDAKSDAQDPGCHTDKNPNNPATYVPTDNDESDTQCSDSRDNDNDTRTDAQDPGCHTDADATDGDATYDPFDNNEGDPQCSDRTDNDGDAKADSTDPGCHTDGNASNTATYTPADDSEGDPECSDERDNDNDGRTDVSDPACHTDHDLSRPYLPLKDSETDAVCSDTRDNDSDERADAADPACHVDHDITKAYVPAHTTEVDPQCSDTRDNEPDGLTDSADPGCHSDKNPENPTSYVPSDDNEGEPRCSDRADNDTDSKTDAQDPGCRKDPFDPDTYDPDDDDELDPGVSPGSIKETD